MADKEHLISLVQKLLKLGDKDKNSSSAEAELAAQRAQELLQKHNLSMADVIVKEEKQLDIVEEEALSYKKTTSSSWEKDLLCIVMAATETQGFTRKIPRIGDTGRISYTFSFHFVGTEWDVAVACELFRYLRPKALKLSRQIYKDSIKKQGSFLKGFCSRLWQRVGEQIRDFKKEQADNEKYALMVVKKSDLIKDYCDNKLNLKEGKVRRQTGSFDYDAYKTGMNEANKVDIGTKNRLHTSKEKQCLQD